MSSLTKIKDEYMFRLRIVVEKRGVMQSAQIAGVDHAYLSRVTRGKQRIGLETLVATVDLLEKHVEKEIPGEYYD